ncbi:MAG: C39 family peptidase [Coriobacteriia bacterium]|nr:C39 family peptidase [Coriobacteriia bacterium]
MSAYREQASSRVPRSARPASAHQITSKIVVAVLLAAIVTIGTVVVKLSLSEQSFASFQAAGAANHASSAFLSTPASQWKAGVMPILYQKDPAWSENAYAGADFGETGCGPTCLAMVSIYLKGGTNITPPVVADMATQAGCVSSAGTEWLFMTEGAKLLGLKAEELSANKDLIVACLSAGRPIIASMGRGDFTTTGHFIVLTKINDDGSISVHDPNSVERTQSAWNLDSLMVQFRNLWVYG